MWDNAAFSYQAVPIEEAPFRSTVMPDASIKVTRPSRAPPRHLFGASPNVSCLLRLFFPDLLQATLFSLFYLRLLLLVNYFAKHHHHVGRGKDCMYTP